MFMKYRYWLEYNIASFSNYFSLRAALPGLICGYEGNTKTKFTLQINTELSKYCLSLVDIFIHICIYKKYCKQMPLGNKRKFRKKCCFNSRLICSYVFFLSFFFFLQNKSRAYELHICICKRAFV